MSDKSNLTVDVSQFILRLVSKNDVIEVIKSYGIEIIEIDDRIWNGEPSGLLVFGYHKEHEQKTQLPQVRPIYHVDFPVEPDSIEIKLKLVRVN